MPKPLEPRKPLKEKTVKKAPNKRKIERVSKLYFKPILESLYKEAEERFKHSKDLDDVTLIFNIYKRTKVFEYLPNGVPYAVVSPNYYEDHIVSSKIATSIGSLSKPIILVSSYLSPEERQEAAMHEFVEWQASKEGLPFGKAHEKALKVNSPSFLRTTKWKRDDYLKEERARIKQKHINNLRRYRKVLIEGMTEMKIHYIDERVFHFGNFSYQVFYNNMNGEFRVHVWLGYMSPYRFLEFETDPYIDGRRNNQSTCIEIYTVDLITHAITLKKVE